jgi:hypothetical protein
MVCSCQKFKPWISFRPNTIVLLLSKSIFAPMKNYLDHSIGLIFLVILLLTSLRFLPEQIRIGDFELRKMDILSDISNEIPRTDSDSTELYIPDSSLLVVPDTSALDSLMADSLAAFGPRPMVDSVFFGRMIEDYSFSGAGLRTLLEAIDSVAQGGVARIAFYGDSFVEGDILIGDLRDTLQTVWGGAGVGFVPITSEVARFKRSLTHEYRHWNTLSIVKNKESKRPFGINGFVYVPETDASVRYDGSKYFRNTQRWNQVRIFYNGQAGTPMVWQIKDMPPQNTLLGGSSKGLGVWTKKVPYPGMEAFAFRFPAPDSSLLVYGATLENGPGVYIDNFSIRGNSGGPLKRLQPALMQQFDRYQQYKLIIIQVGLNAVTNSLNNIKWYRAELDNTFEHLKACFPHKTILVISVGDRDGKVGDEIATMKSVPYIVAMQRDLARKHGFLFYDLYHGMGGAESMLAFANHKPMLANKDYTHLTHDGGRKIGLMLAGVFLDAQKKYLEEKVQTNQ